MEYPHVNKLYKYLKYNGDSISIIANKKIWVAKPESFNDPFDCNVRFKPPEVNSEVFRRYVMKTGRDTGNLHEDYEIFIEGLRQFRNKDMKALGVFSMSEIKDNILMWSHYADQHKGFCIAFDRLPNNLLGDFESTQPVNYYSDYPEVDPLYSNGNIHPSIHKKMLFSKAQDWAGLHPLVWTDQVRAARQGFDGFGFLSNSVSNSSGGM